MVSVRNWVAGGSLRAGLAVGGVYAGLGVIGTLITGGGMADVVGRILTGVLLGVGFALIVRPTDGLSDLTPEQAASVRRAVRRGEAPPESLAEVTVREALRVQGRASERGTLVIIAGFLLLYLFWIIGEGLTGSLHVEEVFRLIFWLVILFWLRWDAGRTIRRARNAEAAARQLGGKHLSGLAPGPGAA